MHYKITLIDGSVIYIDADTTDTTVLDAQSNVRKYVLV
jgi:hypothetical protein